MIKVRGVKESAHSPGFELKIDEMGCIACATTVKNAIKSVKGVHDVDINFEKGTAEVRTSRRDAPFIKAVCESVTAVGFPARAKTKVE